MACKKFNKLTIAASISAAFSAPAFSQSLELPSVPQTSSAAAEQQLQPNSQSGSQQQPNAPIASVVVSGTRLSNPNFTAPTPVSVVSAETLAQRAPTQIADVINEIPAFRISRTAAGSGRVASEQAGVQAQLDLRGLDAVRTLTLINGRRTVGTVAGGTFDTNLIPIGLIKRVEVVTGGASAAYGSDAVAGVVNFILDDKMKGLTGSIQTGRTGHGDGIQHAGTVAGGFSFAEDRGHVVFGADVARTRGVGNMYSRGFGRAEPGLLIDTPAASTAALGGAQVFAENVELANVSAGGLITTRATNGQFYGFDAAGNPAVFARPTVPFINGANAVMVGQASNYGFNPNAAFALQNANERNAVYGRAQFNLNADTKIFVEANYGKTVLPRQQTAFFSVAPTGPGRSGFLVPVASLPTSLQSQYSVPNVAVGRIFTEQGGGLQAWQDVNLKRIVLGAEGSFNADWTWDASYTAGRTHQNFNTTGLVLPALYKAVYGCNGTATNPNLTAALVAQAATYERLSGKTCAAFNPFGIQPDSAAGTNYIFNDQHQQSDFKQDVASFGVSGNPFELPAGDVSVAAGLEWRRESINVVGDQLGGQAQLFSTGNYGSYSGKNFVKEGYVELGVPVLKGAQYAKSLDVNAAARRTSYSTSGEVTTWKTGFTYEPFSGILLRATKSRDIRAPNLDELFFVGGVLPTTPRNMIPGTSGFNGQGTTSTSSAGNPDLVPEKANTLTYGVVLQPKTGVLKGFRAAVDYYNIEVNGVITRPNTAQSQGLCAARLSAGATSCPGIVFNTNLATFPNGISSLTNMTQNLDRLKVEGIDVELAYKFSGLPLPGALSVRGLFNYTIHNQLTTLNGTAERKGSMSGVPELTGNLTFSHELGKLTTDLQFSGFTAVKYNTVSPFASTGPLAATCGGTVLGMAGPGDAGYNPVCPNSVNVNRFAGIVYTNFSARYTLSKNVELFGVVNNLFDRDPPRYAFVASTSSGNNINYDLLGRAFKLGARFKF